LELKMSKRIMVQLDKVILSEDIYPRAYTDYKTVATYAEAMLAGATFPPLAVVQDGEAYYLLDGWHRYRAWKQVGVDSVPIEKLEVPRKDWFAKSLELNAKHGRPLTQKEKIDAIFKLRREGRQDDDIGSMMQLTVDYVRHLVEDKAFIRNQKTGNGIALKPALVEVKTKLDEHRKDVADLEAFQMKMSGQKQFSMWLQVFNLLERNLVNDQDPRVLDTMKKTGRLICTYFGWKLSE